MTDEQEQMLDTIIEPHTTPPQWIEFHFPIMGGTEMITLWLPTALDKRDHARLKMLIDAWPQA